MAQSSTVQWSQYKVLLLFSFHLEEYSEMVAVDRETYVFHILHRIPFPLVFFREMNVFFNNVDIVFLKYIFLS